MGISPRLLGEGEYVVTSTRTHVKALVRPALLLILICGLAGFLAGLVPQDPPLLVWLVWALAAVAIGRWVVVPFLGWFTASYTLTNRRLLTRQGVLTRVGHDIPLNRVHDVWYEYGLLDRVLGCGTLVVAAASERGEIVLPDVPHVEHLHLSITEQLGHDGHGDQYGDHSGGQYDDQYDDGYDGEQEYEPEPRRRWWSR
jgi:membrane protein YdbS with pleckstrin-like domain